MKEIQFTAMVIMALMSLALIMLLPSKVEEDRVANRSRWLMMAGLTILSIQFAVQYIGRFRSVSITQAVLVNLTFFIPAAALLSLSVLNLQRQGRLRPIEWFMGIPVWLVAMIIMISTIMTDGCSLQVHSPQLLGAEIIASAVYGAMQLFYSYLHIKTVIRTEVVMDNYFDQGHGNLLRWMKISVLVLTTAALLVPVLIFIRGWVLVCSSLFLFIGIFYMWFCFMRYVISNASKHVREAEQNAEEEEEECEELEARNGNKLSADTQARLMPVVQRWLAKGNYLHNGITSPAAAREMQIPRYQLTAWVKSAGYTSFSHWMTVLRIEEAKRILSDNPDWSNEAIADHCGISRSHFQVLFHKEVGMTPTQFLTSLAKTSQSPSSGRGAST